MTHIETLTFHGNPNVGLYGYATDKYCLLGKEVAKKYGTLLSEVLHVPVHPITIAGTSLIGVFVTGNKKCLLVPEITYEEELAVLEDLGIVYEVIPTKLTALGNNILCSDQGAIANPEFTDAAVKKIEAALGVAVRQMNIADSPVVGAVAAHNNKGGVIHRDTGDETLGIVEKTIGVPFEHATVNHGVPFVRSGVLCNDYGVIVGEQSGGPELVNIDEALGFEDD